MRLYSLFRRFRCIYMHLYTLPWQCHVNAMAMPWQCHGNATAVPWQCRGNAMAMPWQCHGNAVAMPSQCHGSAPRSLIAVWQCASENGIIGEALFLIALSDKLCMGNYGMFSISFSLHIIYIYI